ncbi:OmpA family protein [Pedobacter montanisoli]|uniref:OmpA family protein n=1 Tax=Pedobacter montanisoli TaxID=2923277 RepID=A0ABS9ZTH9_9SPHI|nr:OmpA family protein [Pedobacter montanisoli]MCJ0741628.1 OmpA family protein [Pedobacter montanisoli]
MNYSTLKKGVAASLVALLGVTSLANAQDAPATSSSAKVFGGRAQYRTWSLGINGGVLTPVVLTGGSDDFSNWEANLGYGLSLRKQLAHSFGLEGNIFRGKVSGTNKDNPSMTPKGFQTDIQYALDLRGVVNVATIDFIRRENSVNFFVTAGYGVVAFNPIVDGKDNKGTFGKDGDKDFIKQAYIPVGAGIKFKVSDRVSFNLAYTMNYVDGDNFDGTYAKSPSKDKFSYGSAGLEFSLGSKAKPNLDWVNPVAMMYDELKDPSLRQEVEALKNRVANVEKSVEDLKKDSDGDGVADMFDKEPNSAPGAVVDGSGRTIKFPEAKTTVVEANNNNAVTGFENIQFDFNSSVLKTESYPTLDKLSSILRENGSKVTVNGYASSEGTAAYNLKLSKDRANSVKTYLVNSGVKGSQVATKGYGEANPIASNDTEEGRIQNRRVQTVRN